MRISTEIHSASRILGEERAIAALAEAGFDAWDFSMFSMCGFDWATSSPIIGDHPLSGPDYLKFARRLKQVGLDHGIVCNQSHAPFPTGDATIRGFLKRAIEGTAEAGGSICIIHPDSYKSAKENAEIYAELLPFAKDCGVKIATENMWGWDREKNESSFAACATPASFCEHIDILGDDFLVACLDVGHAEMRGSCTTAVEMIHALGHRLQALHLHDNDQWRDRHQIPFSMQIDFAAVKKALDEIGYAGYYTLEADQFLAAYDESNVKEGIRLLAEAAFRIEQL